MARRANEDSAATFDRIVQAAKEVLGTRGASDLSLRRVASHAGVSLGTVQYYFSSKDKLIETCLADDSASMVAEIELAKTAVAQGANFEDVLAAGVSSVYRRALRTRETHRLRVMKALDANPTSAASPGPFMLSELGAIAAFMSEDGRISASHARMIVESVAILVARYAIFEPEFLRSLFLLGDDDDVYDAVDEHLQKLTRSLLSGYRAQSLGG
jgi:AcrR family transcriptional regulator